MQRAAILIGVGKSRSLPPLPGATAAVREMAAWLAAQGVSADRISVLTDDEDRVRAQDIKDAVITQLARDDLEQLIVYFSGHGVNLSYHEYWLLSDAPSDTQAAVNVDGSVVLARRCGVPHVIFISDACRTAAQGLNAQFVTGSEIFPNESVANVDEPPIDMFFACTLGMPALEIADATESAKAYTSAYTSALVAALKGEAPTVIERALDGAKRVGIIRPRPLSAYLRNELPKRLQAANVTNYTQFPQARITSEPNAWLSMIPMDDAAPRVQRHMLGRMRTPFVAPSPAAPAPPSPPPAPRESLDSAVQRLVIRSVTARLPHEQPLQIDASVPGGALLAESATRNREPFGPTHLETRCGFKVRGATIRDALSAAAGVEVIGGERQLIHAKINDVRAADVFIEFENGSSVVLPAIPQFICALSFENADLVDVAYEPSEGSDRWSDYELQRDQLRELRAVVSAAAHLGVFRLDESNAQLITRSIRYGTTVDPTMAIFSAYALNDLRMKQEIADIYEAMRDAMDLRLFDVAMIARRLSSDRPDDGTIPTGPFPLLSQGWATLRAYGVPMTALRADLERCLVPSLWTLFNTDGTARLRHAISIGEVK